MRLSLPRLAAAAATAAATAAVSPSAQAADAVYGGSTRAQYPIVVIADKDFKKLRSLVISWAADCGDDQGRVPGSGRLTPVKPVPGFTPGSNELLVSRNANGRFAGTQLRVYSAGEVNTVVQVQIEGKLTSRRAGGTLSAIARVVDTPNSTVLANCQTGRLTWVATRAPGVIFGGNTSQQEPVVVRMNETRKRVNDFLTTWNAPCTPEGLFRAPDHFGNFSVKSSGAFGNPFDYETPLAAGAKRRIDYRLAGRVTRTTARGAVQANVLDTDAAGATTDTCDSGGVTWKAVTG
jgi:hypothetical protein